MWGVRGVCGVCTDLGTRSCNAFHFWLPARNDLKFPILGWGVRGVRGVRRRGGVCSEVCREGAETRSSQPQGPRAALVYLLPLVRINCYSGHSVTPNITPSFFFAEMMVDVAYISEKVISDGSG